MDFYKYIFPFEKNEENNTKDMSRGANRSGRSWYYLGSIIHYLFFSIKLRGNLLSINCQL